MTKLMNKAISEIQKLPDSDQDSIAAIILEEIKSELKWKELFASSQEELKEFAEKAMEEESKVLDWKS